MSATDLNIIILAAGAGKRMHSAIPKVLHQLAGKTLVERVIHTAQQLSPHHIFVVYGYHGEQVLQHLQNLKNYLQHFPLTPILQTEQLGTGHAVKQVLDQHSQKLTGRTLILYGDVPLITSSTLQKFINQTPLNEIGLLTVNLSDPTGYGRIIRNQHGTIQSIVEHKDATVAELGISEINTGIMLIPTHYLYEWLPQLNQQNQQGEYYLTDIIALAYQHQINIHGALAHIPEEVLGVNDRLQLATLERYYQLQQAQRLMQQGVSLRDPSRIDIRGEVTVGHDVMIDVDVILEGHVKLADGVNIGPFTLLRDVSIAANTTVHSHCVITEAEIGEACQIGPYARIRPQTVLHDQVKVGNFVEIKKSQIGVHSKVPHLSYIGDSTVGREVNIGAGTITCNYDGINKYQTIIGDRAFIGSDTQLIAPVEIGEDATIAAGSTVRKNVAPAQLTITHPINQRTIPGWKRPKKTSDR